MKILIIDNYDSFTFNLYQYVGEILQGRRQEFRVDVFRNDAITTEEMKEKAYDRIIISPGPGSPDDPAYFGVCAEVLVTIRKTIPILGVCLGMQGMAHYFGGRVIRAKKPMHGKMSVIHHDEGGIFTGLPQRLEVMRYHSLVADPMCIPTCLKVTAVVNTVKNDYDRPLQHAMKRDIEIMGLRHKEYPIEGIQFHPESFATEGGKKMLENFLFQYIV